MSASDLNSADFQRIEAALHQLIPSTVRAANKWNPKALDAYARTLQKVQSINKTGEFTQR